MPRPAINDSSWAEMTAAQKCEAVRAGRATLRQMVAGVLDGSDELSRACREVLTRTDASLKELTDDANSTNYECELKDLMANEEPASIPDQATSDASNQAGIEVPKRRRLGLPRGYLHRLRRH